MPAAIIRRRSRRALGSCGRARAAVSAVDAVDECGVRAWVGLDELPADVFRDAGRQSRTAAASARLSVDCLRSHDHRFHSTNRAPKKDVRTRP